MLALRKLTGLACGRLTCMDLLHAWVHAGHSDGNPFKDGGVVDRIGLRAWRERRRKQAIANGQKDGAMPPALVHVISRCVVR